MFKSTGSVFRYLLLCFVFVNFSTVSAEPDSPHQSTFNDFREYFIQRYWDLHPSEALYNGYDANDNVLLIYDTEFFKKALVILEKLRIDLNRFKPESLSPPDRIDWFIIRDRIEADIWYFRDFREYEWNPAWYNIGGDLASILGSRKKGLNDKLKTIESRLQHIEMFYRFAAGNLKKPVREHAELGILQNKGTVDFIHGQLRDSLNKSTLPQAEKTAISDRLDITREAILSYVEHLQNLLKTSPENQFRDFRIGEEHYIKKFRHDLQSRYTAGEVYQIALARKDTLHARMAELSRQLWGKYLGDTPMPDHDPAMIRMVLEKISLQHAHRDSFMQAVETQIPDLVNFINDRKLVYLDPEKPLVVRRTPAYMEGSGALVTISSPGPYDPSGNTYYNVSPLSDYSNEEAESLLREYNNYTLKILNIHEAIPGHYTQLVYANKTPSMIKSIFGNGAMIEGWAVYSEQMMLEEGYGNHEPELWLMYYKWHLRSVCNTILDYSVHVKRWNEKVAMKFLTDEAFQETAEAGNKWRRVKLTSVQLCSYFTGYSEIAALREEYKQMKGDVFNLREFHETFLGYGSAPVKYIREMMMKN